MEKDPGRHDRPEQESGVSEASAERRAPQVSQDQSPQEKQEFYWRRQAERLEKELAAARAEREAELNRLSREKDEAASRATEAEWRAKRLSLIAEAGLSSELVELVPEGDPERVAEYVERLKPIAEKLARPRPRGLTNTNPPNAAGGDEARLERLGAEAARGDRRALREYAHLKDRVKRTT